MTQVGQWLRRAAQRITGRAGQEQPAATAESPEALLKQMLAQVEQHDGDAQAIYPQWQQLQMTEALLEVLPGLAEALMDQVATQQQDAVAGLLVRFADLLNEFPLGQIALNKELAIAAYHQALAVRTQAADPEGWASIQNNLGITYNFRIRGDRADNLERAIAAYEQALLVYTRKAAPQDWAMTQNNLGLAYGDRIRGDRADNLERAIAAYEQALLVYTREADPNRWAATQGNLAAALVDLAQQTEAPAQLDQAIDLFEEALEIAIPKTDWFINDQYRLGSALAQRYEQQQNPDDLRRALAAYRAALDSLSPEHYNRESYSNILPQTQTVLGSRLVRDGQWQEGLGLLRTSLETLRQTNPPTSKPANLRQNPNSAQATTLYEIGRAYEILTDWPNARLYYRDALRLFEAQGDDLGSARSRSGLGSILVSQGFFDKGLHQLTAAQETLTQLDLPQEADKVSKLIQAAQAAKAHQLAQKI